MQTPAPHCSALNKRGEPCQARPRRDRPFCLRHDPLLAEQRAEWDTRGGEGRSNIRRASKKLPENLSDTLQTLYRALEGLETGKLAASRATAIANVSRAIVAIWEAGELELRLGEIERLLESADAR